MAKSNASGRKVAATDVPVIMGMIGRGDRHHDIAAWFGLNQGRIKDTQDGKYGPATAASGAKLPPKGPPGIKGRMLRESMKDVLHQIKIGDANKAQRFLDKALAAYDADEL